MTILPEIFLPRSNIFEVINDNYYKEIFRSSRAVCSHYYLLNFSLAGSDKALFDLNSTELANLEIVVEPRNLVPRKFLS